MRQIKKKTTLIKVAVFNLAFAYLEAATVIYLRQLISASHPEIDRSAILLLLPGIAFLQPKSVLDIISNSQLLQIELVRESATLIILAMIASIAGKKVGQRIAFFFFSFAVWDLFYYVFLKLIINWPTSWTDIDIFFLLPVPWLGPVFVPITISFLLVLGTSWYLIRNK